MFSEDKAILLGSISLACDDGGNTFSAIYWYKNGEELVEFANSTRLEISAEHIDNLTGVYQCFGERSGGVFSNTTRVFSYCEPILQCARYLGMYVHTIFAYSIL